MATATVSRIRAQIGQFAIVPVWVLDRVRDARAIQVYAVLAGKYANREGRAWPKQRQLAIDCGVSTKSIERAVADLIAAGALDTKKRRRDDGSVAGLDYTLIQVEPEAPAGEAAVVDAAPDDAQAGDLDLGEGAQDNPTPVSSSASEATTGGVLADPEALATRHPCRGVATPVSGGGDAGVVAGKENQIHGTRSIEPDQNVPADGAAGGDEPGDRRAGDRRENPNPIAAALDYYRDAWAAKYHEPCAIQYGRHVRAVKALLQQMDLDTVKRSIDGYLSRDDQFELDTRHAITAWIQNPSRYLARRRQATPSTPEQARQHTAQANRAHVTGRGFYVPTDDGVTT